MEFFKFSLFQYRIEIHALTANTFVVFFIPLTVGSC